MGKFQSRLNDSSPKKYVALFDYEKKSKEELNLRKNDKLLVFGYINTNVCRAKNCTTNRFGLVQTELIMPINKVELEPWYFGNYSKSATESQLFKENYRTGTFLIRESENQDGNLILSILYIDNYSKYAKHYKIYKKSKNCYYLVPSKKFKTLQDLVHFYSEASHGLCCQLLNSCDKYIKIKKKPFEVKENEIENIQNLKNNESKEISKGYLKNGVQVLIKVTNSSVLNEIEIMNQIEHKHVIKIIAFSFNIYSEKHYMCYENIDNTLIDMLEQNRVNTIKTVVNIARQITSALVYLSKKFIIHRNLRCKNIFSTNDFVIKLANFDLSKKLDINNEYKIKSSIKEDLSLRWLSPELLVDISQSSEYRIFSEKSEIWSFGVLIYELITNGELPYKNISEDMLGIHVIKNRNRLPKPINTLFNDNTDLIYEKILLNCWNYNSLFRPSFSYLNEIFYNYFDLIEPNYNFDRNNNDYFNGSRYEEKIEIKSENDINLGVLISAGNYSETWKANFCKDNRVVAVKIYNQKYEKDDQIIYDKYLNELKILKKLNHPNLIRLCGTTTSNPYFLIMEFAKFGSLLSFLTDDKYGSKIELNTIVSIALDIVNEYLNIVHGNLAARNILLDVSKLDPNQCSAKICDFESARELGDAQRVEIFFDEGSEILVRWLAPESVVSNKCYVLTRKTDVYSFGMILYEMVTKGSIPFKEIPNEKIFQRITTNNQMMRKPSGVCTDGYYLIMKECWNRIPEKRPSFSRLYQIFRNYLDLIEESSFDAKKCPIQSELSLIRSFIIKNGRKKYKIN